MCGITGRFNYDPLRPVARDEVSRRYSFDRMVRAFEDLYLTHLEMPRGVSSRAA